MDLTILQNTDLDSLIAIRSIKAARINRRANVVLLRVYMGATRQLEAFTRALSEATSELISQHDMVLESEVLSSDNVKNSLKWTVAQLVDWLLAADIHIVPCHPHEGSIGKTESWNVENIKAQMARLKYHAGVPMGKHVGCCSWGQDKYEMYRTTYPLCAPSMKIPLEPGVLESEELLTGIKR